MGKKKKEPDIELGLQETARQLGIQPETLRRLAMAGVVRSRRTESKGRHGHWRFMLTEARRDMGKAVKR